MIVVFGRFSIKQGNRYDYSREEQKCKVHLTEQRLYRVHCLGNGDNMESANSCFKRKVSLARTWLYLTSHGNDSSCRHSIRSSGDLGCAKALKLARTTCFCGAVNVLKKALLAS